MPQGKKCRCCLQDSEQIYIYDNLFKKMFRETFNFLPSLESQLPQWMCLSCVVSLKQAKKFRDMVVVSEEQLLRELSKNKESASSMESVNNVWIKEEARDETDDALADEEPTFPPPMKDKKSPGESELDPSKNFIMPDDRSMLCNYKKRPQKRNSEETPNKRRLIGPKKHRENIILLIQNSTILPFRHNSKFLNDYICYYCDNTYNTMKELKEHTTSTHDGKVNDESLMTLMRNRAHESINGDISCIKCRLCDEVLKTIENLIEHLVDVHNKVYHVTEKESLEIIGFDLSTDELKCYLCSDKFESFKFLYSHMNEHFEAHSCVVCGKKFANLLRYRTHMKSHVKQEVSFQCDHCSAVCKSKQGLIYHMKLQHLNITLKCDLCPLTFRFKEHKKRDEHMVEIHGMSKQERKYTCDICQNGKTYSSKNTLKIHKSNIHKVGDIPRYECEFCDFVTHHTKRMSEHMDAHNGVKNYVCHLCGRKFNKACTLRNHIRMHLNDKRFACSLCEEAFVHKITLKKHMKKKHSGFENDCSQACQEQSSNKPN